MRTEGLAPNCLARPCLNDGLHAPDAAAGAPDLLRRPADITRSSGTLLGFWLYLMSDCLLFACLFASYGVLGRNYAGGPSGAELFELPLVAAQHGAAAAVVDHLRLRRHRMQRKRAVATLAWLALTGCWAPASSASSSTSSRT